MTGFNFLICNVTNISVKLDVKSKCGSVRLTLCSSIHPKIHFLDCNACASPMDTCFFLPFSVNRRKRKILVTIADFRHTRRSPAMVTVLICQLAIGTIRRARMRERQGARGERGEVSYTRVAHVIFRYPRSLWECRTVVTCGDRVAAWETPRHVSSAACWYGYAQLCADD